ncbi:hypothetical protein ACWGPT_18475 [Pseudorhizobium sp. NPDC055634]
MREDTADYEVSKENAETILGRSFPWYQRAASTGKQTYFAVCPRCENPIKLVAIYTMDMTAHGRHEPAPVPGFDHFDLDDMTWCATRLPRSPVKTERRALTPLAKAIIRVMIQDFDRAIRVLSDSVGFRISEKLAREFLASWFDAEGYRYVGANVMNIPWMLAYFSPTKSLVGRYIHDNEDLVAHIRERVDGAVITDDRRLEQAPKTFTSITFEFIGHEVIRGDDGSVAESMIMRVARNSHARNRREMVPLLRQTIEFDEARFSALRSVPAEKARRNEGLLKIAEDMAVARMGEDWKNE